MVISRSLILIWIKSPNLAISFHVHFRLSLGVSVVEDSDSANNRSPAPQAYELPPAGTYVATCYRFIDRAWNLRRTGGTAGRRIKGIVRFDVRNERLAYSALGGPRCLGGVAE